MFSDCVMSLENPQSLSNFESLIQRKYGNADLLYNAVQSDWLQSKGFLYENVISVKHCILALVSFYPVALSLGIYT